MSEEEPQVFTRWIDHTIEQLLQENKQLKEENARLKEWKEDLLNENIELENIRKEAIEYIKANTKNDTFCEWYDGEVKDLLEILGDKEKIPEKFKVHNLGDKDKNGNFVSSPFPTNEEFMNKINDIIDYLDYLKSKGDKENE